MYVQLVSLREVTLHVTHALVLEFDHVTGCFNLWKANGMFNDVMLLHQDGRPGRLEPSM